MDETTGPSLPDLGKYFGDFAQSALNGLGIGSGSDAAKTVGSLLKPSSPSGGNPPPPPAPSADGPSIPGASAPHSQTLVIGLALVTVAYLVLR